MCENGKHFFYFVRLITFSYYSLLKEAILQKKKTQKWSETRCSQLSKKLSGKMEYRYTFYSILQAFSRKRCYCNEMENLEGSLHTCRDNVHETVPKVSRVLLDSAKRGKHSRLPNKQTAELQTF